MSLSMETYFKNAVPEIRITFPYETVPSYFGMKLSPSFTGPLLMGSKKTRKCTYFLLGDNESIVRKTSSF